jgi:spermidine/putrescine transport system substrate-binding protein
MLERNDPRRPGRTCVSRRQMLARLATVGVVAATFPLVRRPARAEPNLTVFTWADYDQAMFHQGFIDKHGGSPEFTLFAEVEEALQKLRSGFNPDVSHPCTSDVARWHEAGVLKPIDTSRLEGWNDVFPTIREISGTVIDGQQLIMPWDWGNESILVRKDLIGEFDNSLALLTDERYKGKLSMYNSVDSMVAAAGKIAGAADVFNMTDEEIEKTRAVMKQIHGNLKYYWDDTTQVQQGLASGELVAAWAWNEAMWNLKAEGLDVEYLKPKEGMFTWVCGLALINGSEGSEDQAYDFLNAMLSPASGVNLINEFGYGHSNQKSFAEIDPAHLEELGIADVDKMLAETNFYEQMPTAMREKMVTIYDEVKAGM